MALNNVSMNTLIKVMLPAAMLLSGSAQAALEASLTFKQANGVVGPADTIEVWGTLSLAPTSDPLIFDASVGYPFGLPSSLFPTQGWDDATFQRVDFASYTNIYLSTGSDCVGNLYTCDSTGEYNEDYSLYSSSQYYGTAFGVNPVMLPGESRDLLLLKMTPKDGSAEAGDYVFYNSRVGFSVDGIGINGNEISASIWLGETCGTFGSECAFTRTVVSSVPLPEAASLFGSVFWGLTYLMRRPKSSFFV